MHMDRRGLLLPRGMGPVDGGVIATTPTVMTAIKLYILRMNRRLLRDVQTRVESSLPARFRADWAIGLAIRAGDKCARESDCPPFGTYMRVVEGIRAGDATRSASSLWTRPQDVVLTSESAQMVVAHRNWTRSASDDHCAPAFRFITNSRDVMQGHGNPRAYRAQADEIMASSLSSLVLQLHARHVILNCCSSFHRLLGDILTFASGRCGWATGGANKSCVALGCRMARMHGGIKMSTAINSSDVRPCSAHGGATRSAAGVHELPPRVDLPS